MLSTFRIEEGRTIIGGTVHVFRSCVRAITACAFCHNAGIPVLQSLAAKGALYIESPTCELALNSTRFEDNEVALDGGAVQARRPCLPPLQHVGGECNISAPDAASHALQQQRGVMAAQHALCECVGLVLVPTGAIGGARRHAGHIKLHLCRKPRAARRRRARREVSHGPARDAAHAAA